MESSDNRDLLMTYTVFHIGTYITLAAAIFAAQNFGVESFRHWAMRVTMGTFVVAGICGAVIASNLPETSSLKEYRTKPIVVKCA